MNASLSDGNEPVIDIFILSANSLLSAQLEKQLSDEGYVVTLFSDGSHLLETLRNGKPNLLMCDATLPDVDAFEVCRQIKADDFLWNIPVLIVTGAADLGDLLRVLDCNADNFIAHPFDPPYLLSLIEGMLTVPVERQTAEQIKTQFKIRHNNQVFVVTADRRKLLEFLLSSFEIAVNKSADLLRAQENIQNLGLAISKLEDTVHENTRVIDIINETLKTKELKLGDLTGQLADRELTIREKIAAIDQLSQDLLLEKSSHAETRSVSEHKTKEQETALAHSRSTIDQQLQQISGQSLELATLKPALERTKEELLSETRRRQETENTLSTTAMQKDEAERALLALTAEHEQLKIDLGAEKNHAQEVQQELETVLQAKTRSEQEMTQTISDLKASVAGQAAALDQLREESASEISLLKGDLESEHLQLQQTEERLNAVTAEKTRTEQELTQMISDLKAAAADQAVALDRLREESSSEISLLKGDLESEHLQLQQTEERLNAVTAEKTRSEQELTQTISDLKASVAGQAAALDRLREESASEIARLQGEVESGHTRHQDTEERLNAVTAEKTRTEQELTQMISDLKAAAADQAAALDRLKEESASEIALLRGEVEAGQARLRDTEERLNTVSSEKNLSEQELTQTISDLKAAAAERAVVLDRLKEESASEIARLQGEVESGQGRLRDTEEQLNTLSLEKKRSEQELTQTISDLKAAAAEQAAVLDRLKEESASEIARLQGEVESGYTRHQDAEERLNAVTAEKTRSEQELAQTISALKAAAAEQAASLARLQEESASEIARLQGEVESGHTRHQDTEGRLNAVTAEKTRTEQELTQMISDLKASVAGQAAALDRLKEESASEIARLQGEVESGQARLHETEERLNTVTAEKGESEASLRAAVDAGQRDHAGLQARFDTVRSQLEEKDQAIKILSDEIAAAASARESAEQRLESVSRELADANAALAAEARTAAVHKEDLAALRADKEKADALAASLAGSLKELQDQVDEEKGRYGDNEERMNQIILQRDQELGDLRRLHEDAKTAVSSHKKTLEQMQRDLDSAVSARTELAERLRVAEEKVHRVSQDLESSAAGRRQEKQQSSSLADALERVKTNLEKEAVRRQEAEDQLREAQTLQQQLEQDLERFVAETRTLHADLTAERRLHEATKQQTHHLEEQVSALSREKLDAERAAADLTAEISQARTALADEWEDHMTDNERLEEAAGTKLQPGSVSSMGMRKEAEIIKKRSLIVKVPTAPAEVRPLPRPMVALDPGKASEPLSTMPVDSVEDLFEDDLIEEEKPADEPVVSIIREPATEPVTDVLPDTIPGRTAEEDAFFEIETPAPAGAGDTAGEDIPVQSDTAPVAGQGIAFNRTQWLDLLKWSHHCDALTQDQRLHIVRMGRLIQKGRKLTRRQEEQVQEMIGLVRGLGYRFP